MSLLDEDFAARLESVRPAAEVIDGLFSSARDSSEERMFTAVVGLERSDHEGKNYLQCQTLSHLVVQQFAEYFSQINVSIGQSPEPSTANFLRRLQMLAYSQFWECHAIKRLLMQLVQIADGKEYDPRLLMDNRPKTANVFKFLVAHSKRLNLSLAEFLPSVYSNQIRNAFAHSQFCVLGDYISFFNFDAKIDSHVPSLKLDTWDELWRIASEFIIVFFETRRALERELISKMPYRVELEEFTGPFNLSRDGRGHWSAQPTKEI